MSTYFPSWSYATHPGLIIWSAWIATSLVLSLMPLRSVAHLRRDTDRNNYKKFYKAKDMIFAK